MGAGCSSPLRRMGGGKRTSKLHRDSSSEFGDRTRAAEVDTEQSPEHRDLPSQQQSRHLHSASLKTPGKLPLDNELTAMSEAINDDHPSSASYYTDLRNNNEETKISELSASLDPSKAQASLSSEQQATPGSASMGAKLAARIMGLNGPYYTALDRHLLVSPALSPAPSTCYSPSPASSTPSVPLLDLGDLFEAFRILTLGSPLIDSCNQKRINLPPSQPTTFSSLLSPSSPDSQNYYTQQLVQTKQDLDNSISVIFITTDNFQQTPVNSLDSISDTNTKQQLYLNNNLASSDIEALANQIESNLKSYCDEHLFNLKFLNLSREHLGQHFHINNQLDVSMKILENEFSENNQRMILIILSNGNPISNETTSCIQSKNLISDQSTGQDQSSIDNRHLPNKIEAQAMIKLLNSLEEQVKELFKRWYNQIGTSFYLNPIYLVHVNILSHLKEERDKAWQSWLVESRAMIKALSLALNNDPELSVAIKLNTIFEHLLDFLIKEPTLQKKTLLVRNYSPQTLNSVPTPNLQNQTLSNQNNRDANINDLARSLADQNKLTLKASSTEEYHNKTIIDWLIESFGKFIESVQEGKTMYGKHVPPFIEKNLFIELSSQRHHLEHYLDSINESYESKCNSFFTNQIAPIINAIIGAANCSESNPSLPNSDTTASVITDDPPSTPTRVAAQKMSTNHLVFISGPSGCGKSTLFSQLIKLAAHEVQNKAQLIYRFCGISLDSFSPNRLFRSICEQFCQTQGENITAASYIYSARKEIINALNKIIKMQTSFIFLDGLDSFKYPNDYDLDWLCEIEPNARVKFFIMLETNSDLYKKALNSYTDATYISLDNPSLAEWAQMLISSARSRRFYSSGNFYENIKKIDINESSPDQLTYRDVGNIILMCRIRQMNNESTFPELTFRDTSNNSIQSVKDLHQVVLSHLHYLVTPYLLCALLVMISSSRNGLCDSDIVNIMSIILINQSGKYSGNQDRAGEVIRFSSNLLYYIKLQLQPYITYVNSDKMVKTMISETFASKAIKHYVSTLYPNIVSEVREVILEYFSHGQARMHARIKSSSSRMMGKIDVINLTETKERISQFDRSTLASHTSEIVNLLLLTDPIKAREYILNKNQFFFLFLYGNMPEEFIEDYQRLKHVSSRKSSNQEELQCLVNYIRQSVYPLKYDGSQIFSQIYCRAYETNKTGKSTKSKRFNEILNLASNPPLRNLLPISEASINSFIRTRIGHSTTNSVQVSVASGVNKLNKTGPGNDHSGQQFHAHTSGGQQARQRIFTIIGNHRHVIVVYPDKGSLSVWDIYDEKAVRTIHNLDEPRDLRMIDQKRSVILCNRELRVYDLDSGQLLTKLKGVMNQKMPFFEVYDGNYVVALARNRMYVNMLNLNTGELETTFKVGEDRFLNSLLVSANGGICVCGDETQKPFPLLVWNLNERRLMYDLRLDRHEFITKLSAISDDGTFVVSVCKQLGESESFNSSGPHFGSNTTSGYQKTSPNFIVIYDLSSGTLFKKWKPGLDSCAVAITVTANRCGKVINTLVDSSIIIWDLATGSKKHTLKGHNAPVDVIRVQNNRLFSMDSSCKDQSLRIWDIEEGYCISVFSSDAPINCCQLSIRGDALVCGFAAETRLSTLVICKNESVNDVVKRNRRRKSSKSLYIFDEPQSRKQSQ